MKTEDYLQKEDELLKSILEVYNKNYFSDFFTSIIRTVALEVNEKLDYLVLTKDGSPDTDGAEVENLFLVERIETKETAEKLLKEKDSFKIFGNTSFLPLLFSEYTIGKNRININ